MAQVGNLITNSVISKLGAPTGMAFSLAAISEREDAALAEIRPEQVIAQNIHFELAERSTGVQYPAVYVYCDTIANELREKFRIFSGTVRMAAEVRISAARLEGLDRLLHLHVEAVTDVLDANRGDWGQGMFYGGGYEISFGAIKHGGRNFVQAAKITFDVDVSQ